MFSSLVNRLLPARKRASRKPPRTTLSLEPLEQRLALAASVPDLNVTYIERTPRYDFDAPKNNPTKGDLVTFTAHVRDWNVAAIGVEYAWKVDRKTVASGVLDDLQPGEERVVDFAWRWKSGQHTIQFEVDPRNKIAEESEVNNLIVNRTDGLAVGFWVEQSVYDYFQEHQRDLQIGSNSWEDWAQRHVQLWNTLNEQARYPLTRKGVQDQLRLDKVVIVPDGALPLHGGLPGNNPDATDRTVDLMWGFGSGLLEGDFYRNTTGLNPENPFYREYSLIHELGHARYLIDGYGFDVANNADVTQVQILENGSPVAGSPLMPFLAFDSVLYYNQSGGIMSGPYGNVWSPYEAAALNQIAGQRASQGNQNAPGNIGVYLQDLPSQNHLRLLGPDGKALKGASVKLFRATPGPGWYGKVFDNVPDLVFTADKKGYIHMPRNPFSDGAIVHTYGNANGLAILRIEHQGRVWYRFMEVTEFNMEYWRGHTANGYYKLNLTTA